jgi:DNA-binding NarL/FixJ family response regulator
MASGLKVVVADDEALFREAVRLVVEQDSRMEVIGEAANGADLLGLLRRVETDVVLLDLAMPPLDGLECVERVCQEHPELNVIVLSGSDDARQIDGALRRGARGYVLKLVDPTDLPAVIRQVVEATAFVVPRATNPTSAAALAGAGLSERELAVLAELAQGLTNKDIAARLSVSEQTVKFHVRNVYRKLGISSRTEALRFAHEHDIVPLSAA